MTVQLDVGSWGLFCGQGGRQLVLVDDHPCGPLSARKATRLVPRRLLLDEGRVAEALNRDRGVDEIVEFNGSPWRVVVQVRRSPKSDTPLCVFAGVFSPEDRLPGQHLVGVWEWVVGLSAEGPPKSDRRTYWDAAMFDLYEIAPEDERRDRGHWDAGEWSSALIDEADQMRVTASIRDGIQEGLQGTANGFRSLTYNVVTGYGTADPGRAHMRLIGMVATDASDGEAVILRGVTYRVPDDFHDIAFEGEAERGRVDEVLRAVMALTGECIAVVDVTTLDVLMSSTTWREQYFGRGSGLGEFLLDEDDDLRDFIREGALVGVTGEPPRSREVALRAPDGSRHEVRIIVTGANTGVWGTDAVVRLDFESV